MIQSIYIIYIKNTRNLWAYRRSVTRLVWKLTKVSVSLDKKVSTANSSYRLKADKNLWLSFEQFEP